MLDSMEKEDPEGYKQFVAQMQAQMLAAGMAGGDAPQGNEADLLDMLKKNSADMPAQG